MRWSLYPHSPHSPHPHLTHPPTPPPPPPPITLEWPNIILYTDHCKFIPISKAINCNKNSAFRTSKHTLCWPATVMTWTGHTSADSLVSDLPTHNPSSSSLPSFSFYCPWTLVSSFAFTQDTNWAFPTRSIKSLRPHCILLLRNQC